MTDLIKRKSKNPISLQSEVNKLFNNFFSDDFNFPIINNNEDRFLSPAIDIKENKKEVVITAELPGVSKDDLEVTIDNDKLIIKGEKKSEEETKEDNLYCSPLRN